MTEICPTVTADTADDFRTQMERVATFARRVHIDLSDGVLAPRKLIDASEVWWPGGMRADLHVMYKRPLEHLDALVALGPQLIILHAEGEGDFMTFAEQVHHHGIEVGVALLAGTPVSDILPAVHGIDHALVFSGNLGHFGGQADLQLLDKVRELRAAKPTLEIGWDGGITADNSRRLAEGGVDVLNVGGFIQKATDPAAAYAKLISELGA